MEWMLFRGNSLTYIIIGGVLDFYFFAGGASPLSVVDQYTQLVGRPAPMPSWALENEEELMEAKTENEEELIEAEAENRAMRSRWRNPRDEYGVWKQLRWTHQLSHVIKVVDSRSQKPAPCCGLELHLRIGRGALLGLWVPPLSDVLGLACDRVLDLCITFLSHAGQPVGFHSLRVCESLDFWLGKWKIQFAWLIVGKAHPCWSLRGQQGFVREKSLDLALSQCRIKVDCWKISWDFLQVPVMNINKEQNSLKNLFTLFPTTMCTTTIEEKLVMMMVAKKDNTRVPYSSRDDILPGLKDILRTIPRHNMLKSAKHLQFLEHCGLASLLAKLLDTSENKEIAKECVTLFLIDPKTSSGFFFPRSIQSRCAPIILNFCGLFRHATDDDEQQLYDSCRETLVSILKSIAFANRKRYFGIATSLSACDLRSLKRDFQKIALFSLHLRRAIEDHLPEKGLSLPVNMDDLEEGANPCYLVEISQFHTDFSCLLTTIELGLHGLKEAIWGAGGKLKFNTGWSLFLFILKELHNISKLYGDGEDRLSTTFREHPLAINYLIRHSKRGDDHLWLLKYDSAIDFKSRRHLMVMMFPEVKDDNEKLHKLLINRSLLFKESFELIGHVNPKSLHNGIFVEFKDEVATGHGVLREWLLLVCQALFSPENSLFQECPEDRRRFFPNLAQLKPEQLDLFGFCGRVIALAVLHKVQVGIAFDRVFFLQLAGEEISLEDDAMGLTFVREIEGFGSRKTVDLCPGGSNIVVNSNNREQYVHLLIQHIFVKYISAKVAYFARGFADMLCKRRLGKSFFQATGLKGFDCALLGGDNPILLKDWKAHTMYEGYREMDEQICWFWKVVEGTPHQKVASAVRGTAAATTMPCLLGSRYISLFAPTTVSQQEHLVRRKTGSCTTGRYWGSSTFFAAHQIHMQLYAPSSNNSTHGAATSAGAQQLHNFMYVATDIPCVGWLRDAQFCLR
ncbi:hypothetical protein C5167_001045 [Papaver somniferum]|uniref:HECT-type E3 ubiquitin transferase n=1 Tax=Papaver somniferum TaxID=3469 RepID=A0A4Y7KTV7_PAPSO|nr:hypothetical protein C5167_001045 [Papaver somniferum]